MKKILTIALMTMLAAGLAWAQERSFTLEDLNFGGNNYRNMIPANRTLRWWGDELIRVSGDTLWSVALPSGKERVMCTLADVKRWTGNDALRSLAGATFPIAEKPLMLLNDGNRRMLVDFKRKRTEWSQTAKGQTHADWNACSRAAAFIEKDNLYIIDADGNRHTISTDGSRQIVYGQSVHRSEFGIDKGTFWNPDGSRLAFYRMDQSMVDDYPLIDVPEPTDSSLYIATPAPEKYPMAGQRSHVVAVGVYDLNTRKTVYLATGDSTDRYFTNIAWSTDGNTIYIQELNRDQNDCRLVSYDAATGQRTGQLYRETDDRYVEPQHPITFLPWDNDKFLMFSQRDGYNHLYLYNRSGQMIRQVTRGAWVVKDILGFDREKHNILITANAVSPIQMNLFRVNIDTGEITRVDQGGRGWHTGALSMSGRWMVDNYQESDLPRQIAIIDTRKAVAKTYFTAPDPWAGYAVPEYRCGTIKADDGQTDLYYRMVMPVGFDPAKKYPTVVYVYGGPHAHNVGATWHYASRSWETYMAQRGYLLFILDNRGSENRGKDFEQATFRQLGQVEMRDQMQGVKFLQSLEYVDTARMGVHGWSFGGFMTISLMTNYPDVFKVGVAGGPVIDWRWYEVMYGERYMDTPQTNPEGYARTSLIPKAKDLKGRLQVITGLNDPTVVPQHAYSFLKACIAAGTQPDFYVYPGQGHNMRGHQSVHLHERITRYFDDYLK